MAELSIQDRERVWRGIMRYWSRTEVALGALSKPDLLAAVNATDTFIESNQVAFNNSLPPVAKTALTQDQKTLLFCAVALMRVDPGVAEFLKCVFGEVD